MKKAAAIDIGTNSMRLILCELLNNNIVSKRKFLDMTRIGENVSRTGSISNTALHRNLAAIKHFKEMADAFGAESLAVIATSAVRDAANGQEFAEMAEKQAHTRIRIIDGQEEAELGIIGVLSEPVYKNANVLVIDIGGGSTELILCKSGILKYSDSVNAGAVRMTEQCISKNPVSEEDIRQLDDSLSKKFEKQIEALASEKIDYIVAIGGTATTMAAMFHNMSIYQPQIVHNTVIDISFMDKCFNRLAGISIEQRYEIQGLQKERADIIVAGVYILKFLMDKLSAKEVLISDNDNLEGAVIKYLL